jgi:hypothetical protein
MSQWQPQNDPRQQPPPYGWQPPQGYYPPRPYVPPPPRRRTYTYQRGSNAFHWTMVVLTCGAWFLVWPFFRRKVRVTTKYR